MNGKKEELGGHDLNQTHAHIETSPQPYSGKRHDRRNSSGRWAKI